MMGPLQHSLEYSPGTLVKYENREIHQSKGCRIGTIIENFVDVVIESGKRTEKAYVLWEDGTGEWVFISLLSPI